MLLLRRLVLHHTRGSQLLLDDSCCLMTFRTVFDKRLRQQQFELRMLLSRRRLRPQWTPS